MRTHRLALAVAGSVVLALALTACGEGDAGSESVESAATRSTDPTVTPRDTSASATAAATGSASATGESTKDADSRASGKDGGIEAGPSSSTST